MLLMELLEDGRTDTELHVVQWVDISKDQSGVIHVERVWNS